MSRARAGLGVDPSNRSNSNLRAFAIIGKRSARRGCCRSTRAWAETPEALPRSDRAPPAACGSGPPKAVPRRCPPDPHATAKICWRKSSSISCRTLPGGRRSSGHRAKRSESPSRSSIALSSSAPPLEFACSWSNLTSTGREQSRGNAQTVSQSSTPLMCTKQAF